MKLVVRASLPIATLCVISWAQPLQLQAQGRPHDSETHWYRFARSAEGTVQLEVTVSDQGAALDARVVSGPEELRKEALQLALSRLYQADRATRRLLSDVIDFTKAPPAPVATGVPATAPVRTPLPKIEETVLDCVDIGLSTELQPCAAAVMSQLRTGQRLTSGEVDRLRAALTALDLGLGLRVRISRWPTASEPRLKLVVNQQPSTEGAGQIHIGPQVQEANLIHRVDPVYPELARQSCIQGTVRLTVTIAKDGSVQQSQLVSGHPMLVESAQKAIEQFKYRPGSPFGPDEKPPPLTRAWLGSGLHGSIQTQPSVQPARNQSFVTQQN